jgi:LemA protein
MSGIMVAVENYPDLKASQNFLQLQGSWNEIEEQISASRRAFNATVITFNNSVETFPSNIMAGIMNYKRRTLFEIPDIERQNINAKELFFR